MASDPNPKTTPTDPPHHHTLATTLKSPLTPTILRALSILFPTNSRT
jgi:hypothetical protein